MPRMFSGAGFANGVLSLPAEVGAAKLRLSLVKNQHPEDFEVLEMKVDRVLGWAALPPRNLALTGPDGDAVWSFPGETPPGSSPVTVEFSVPLETALTAALQDSRPLEASFRLQGDAPGKAMLFSTPIRGALSRSFPGVLRTKLAGDPQYLDIGQEAAAVPLAGERPHTAIADLTVRYEGIRLLETISDAVPTTAGGLSGPVVTDRPVIRSLPPAALSGYPLVRIGLIGRAPEACELVVQPVDLAGGEPGTTIGPPGVLAIDPSPAVATVWVDLPEIEIAPGPVGVSARTNRGRFLWAGQPDPLVRLAVRDPDPGGRPLRLNGAPLLAVTAAEAHDPAVSLPPAAFQRQPPLLDSHLFLTVDVSDLILKYRR